MRFALEPSSLSNWNKKDCGPSACAWIRIGASLNPSNGGRSLARPERKRRAGRVQRRVGQLLPVPLWPCGYAALLRFSRRIRGCRAAILSNASAGPSGARLPCSQFRSVWTLIPMATANLACVNPTKRLSATISSPDSICPSRMRLRVRAGMALENCCGVSSGISVIGVTPCIRDSVSAQLVLPIGLR